MYYKTVKGKMRYSMPFKLLKDSCGTPNFYETSNQRDFKGTPGKPADNARPDTSKFYTYTEPVETGYKSEFSWKTVVNENTERPGTASGDRKNNPHPNEAFMVWKFPNKKQQILLQDEKLKGELLEELCRDKIRSTYQVDYEKEKQHAPNKHLPKGQSHIAPHTLDTTVRADFQPPLCNYRHLNCHTTRYGSNANKCRPAFGAVPTVLHDSPLMKSCYNTSYEQQFEHKTELAHYLQNMSTKEREVVKDLLDNVQQHMVTHGGEW